MSTTSLYTMEATSGAFSHTRETPGTNMRHSYDEPSECQAKMHQMTEGKELSSPSTVSVGSHLYQQYQQQHQQPEPQDLQRDRFIFHKALDEYRNTGALHDTELFEMSSKIGKSLLALGHCDDALMYFRQALHFKNKTIDLEPPGVQAVFAEILFDVGVIHSHPLSYNRIKALQAFTLCLDVRFTCFGSDHPAVASVLYNLAIINIALGEEWTAVEQLLEALSILQFHCPQQNHLQEVWMTLGRLQLSLNETEDALSSFEEAAELIWSHRCRHTKPTEAIARNMGRLVKSMGNGLVNRVDLNTSNDFFFSACLWPFEREVSEIEDLTSPTAPVAVAA
jgi:Tetratricopeptide repeat